MNIKIGVPTNWMTTLGGLLAGLPPIVITSFMSAGAPLGPRWTAVLSIVGGVGTLLIGLAAKDANTHSTQDQIQAATAKVAAGGAPKV